jgi:hypothetical protein
LLLQGIDRRETTNMFGCLLGFWWQKERNWRDSCLSRRSPETTTIKENNNNLKCHLALGCLPRVKGQKSLSPLDLSTTHI